MDAETVAGLLGDSGISVRQLRNYCDLGCPFEKRGRERVFNWFAVLDWYITFKASGGMSGDPMEEGSPPSPRDQRSENLRMTIAAADLKELQLGKLRGEVIVTADAKKVPSTACSATSAPACYPYRARSPAGSAA